MLLHYKKYGTVGEPIFILHGIFGMLDNWHNIAKHLAENNFTVYTLDARNHGQSGHSEEMSYQLMAQDVVETAQYLGISKFHLIGHSMGGKTAMWLAHQFPNYLLKLIIVDIAPKTYKAAHVNYFNAYRQINWDTLETRQQIDDAFKTYDNDISVRLFLAKNIDRHTDGKFHVKINLDAIENAYQEIIEKLPLSNQYEGKSLFIKGALSNYVKTEDENSIKEFFPNTIFDSVANAGHWVHADNPKEFLNKVLQFLNN